MKLTTSTFVNVNLPNNLLHWNPQVCLFIIVHLDSFMIFLQIMMKVHRLHLLQKYAQENW